MFGGFKIWHYEETGCFSLFSSRSTLQNYLKKHEGNDATKGNPSSSNPFDKGGTSVVFYIFIIIQFYSHAGHLFQILGSI